MISCTYNNQGNITEKAVVRFIQEDVYRGNGLNLYAYCGNNPIRYYDLSGYSEQDNRYKGDTVADGEGNGGTKYSASKGPKIKSAKISKGNGKANNITKAEDVKWKGFSSKKNTDGPYKGKTKLQGHYQKHVVEGNEFGDITQNEYLKLAKDFASEVDDGFNQQQINNIVIKYDPNTRRTFVGNIKDREIRTFYKADYRDTNPFEAAVKEASEKYK